MRSVLLVLLVAALAGCAVPGGAPPLRAVHTTIPSCQGVGCAPVPL